MAVRQDSVQLKIDFITDESRILASTLQATKQYNDEVAKSSAMIRKYQAELAKVGADESKRLPILTKISEEEKKIAVNLGKVADEGKKVAGLNLNNVAPAQLTERARQLALAMRDIPSSLPEFKALEVELTAVNSKLRELNQTAKGISTPASGGSGKSGIIQNILGVAGGVGIVSLVQQAVGSLVNFGRAALTAVDEGLKADAQVKTAIESTKGAAGRSFEELKAQAEELQKVTLFGDDATQGAQALLLTFKNIKTEVFDQAVPLALDLSQAFGQDLKASAIQLGKALDDPIKGVTALRRVGVSFSEDQQKMINSLVETGKTADAQKIILKELETQVGGSARAAAEAGLGPYQLLQNRLGEVQESIGGLISNGLQVLAPFLLKVVKFVEQLTERFTSGKRATGEFSFAVEVAATIFNAIGRAFQVVGGLLEVLVSLLEGAGKGIGLFIDYVRQLPVVGELIDTFIITPIRFVADALENLPAAWAGFVAATKQAALNIANDLLGLVVSAKIFVKNIESALTLSSESKKKLENEIRGLESQKAAAAKAGKTIGEAYTQARDAVLAQSATAASPSGGAAPKSPVDPNGPGDEEAARKRIEDRLKNELQAIELGIQKRELLLENERIKGEVTEKEYNDRLAKITEDGLNKKLEVYRVFHREQTNEALKLQNELAVIEQGKQLKRVNIDTVAPGAAPGSVTSQKAPGQQAANQTSAALAVQDIGEGQREAVLREKFQKLLITEQDYELQRLELKKQALAEEIAILQASGPEYSAAVQKKQDESLKIEEEIGKKKVENAKRTEDLKNKVEQEGLAATADLFGLAAEILAQDEKARKKNAGAIKAFQIAQVIINGISEVSKIWEQSSQLGPIAGPIVGGLQTAVAVVRAGIAINKIQNTKFAGGGFTGMGYGAPDDTGHRPAGVVHAGEYVAPASQVNDPETGPVVRWLNERRLRGYATGGFVAPNTTPSASASSFASQAAPQLQNMDMFIQAVAMFNETARNFPKEVKSRVVYTEIEDAGNELNGVRNDAAL